MSAIFKILLLAACLALHPAIHAQDAVPAPCFRFITATGMPGNVKYLINGFDIKAAGFPSGYCSGLVNYRPKTYHIRASHPALGEAQLSFELKPGDNKTLVAYTFAKHPKKNGGPPQKELRLFCLDASKTRTQAASINVLQITPLATLSIHINGMEYLLKQEKPRLISVKKGTASIMIGSSTPVEVDLQKRSPCNLVIYADENSAFQAIHCGT